MSEDELRYSLGLTSLTSGKGKVDLRESNMRPIEVFMCSVVCPAPPAPNGGPQVSEGPVHRSAPLRGEPVDGGVHGRFAWHRLRRVAVSKDRCGEEGGIMWS